MKARVIALLLISLSYFSYAQQHIESLSKLKIDSLQRNHIDTIIYYQSSCGECEIKGNKSPCFAKSGYAIISNVIIYQQNGNSYTLDFDCHNRLVKKKLDSCKSIPYFISIISKLNARDKFVKALYKKGKFLGPTVSDGGFEEANIFLNKITQSINMSDSEQTDLYSVYKKYFWTDKQIKLIKLIQADLKEKINQI